MNPLHYKSATELASLIRRKKFGALELLDHFLARVEKYNPKLNAIVWMDTDKARKRAKAADAAVKKGKGLGPLHGVPMTIKESYQVAGSPTTWGAPSMKENVTNETAVAAQRMIDAGVTLFGKCNVPLMLADWQSYNAVYGVTGNPWDTAARRVALRADRRQRWRPVSPASTRARTSARRSAIRRITAACSAISRPTI